MAGAGDDPKLKATKAMIRSVLMSVKEGVPAARFLSDYHGITGETIPFKQLGFSNMADFIKSIPDVVFVKQVQGQVTYFAVADAATQHIQNLIQRQKSNPKKSKSLRKGQARFPKFHSQISRSYASHGGYKAGLISRPPPSRVSMFGQPRPFAAFTPSRVASPVLPTPFSSSHLSPLTVTVHNRAAGEPERTIERQSSSSGGKEMASRALRAVVGQKQHEKKSGGSSRTFEVPPRFLKLNATAAATSNTSTDDRPVAGAEDRTAPTDCKANISSALDSNAQVVQPSPQNQKVDESQAGPAVAMGELPGNAKAWAAKLLKDYPSGLWSSRFKVLYKEEFGQEPPANLMDIVQTWTDVLRTEMNTVANRHVLYPASQPSQQPADGTHRPSVFSRLGEQIMPRETPPKQPTPKWQNFIVPIAQLFEVGEMTDVYASYSQDLNHFFLQEADSCVDEITEKLNGIYQDSSQVVIPKVSDLQPGVFCSALFSEDNSWYRARVLFLDSDTEVQVIFVDYGNVEKVSISKVRCLTQEVAEIPAQAVGCAMFALKPFDGENGWSEEAKSTFHTLMADKKLQAHTCKIEEGNCVVELWSDDNLVSLNEQLYNARLVDTYLPKNVEPADLELPQDSYVEVVVAFVDLTHCWLRLIGPDYSEKLDAFEDSLAALYKEARGRPKRLQEGSICIAHPEMLYHRIRIRELRDAEANCFFVDHGYSEWLPLDQLAPLDADTNQSLPYQAVCCVLMGLDRYMSNPITITELVERSRNKICVAEIIIRDPLKVMLYDTHGEDDININEEIAKRLQTEGHSIDMTQFSPTIDSTTDSSGAASPPPSTTPAARERAVEELQAVTKRLTVTDEASQTSGVGVNGGAGDTASMGGRGAEQSPGTVPTNGDSLKSSSLSAGSQSSKPAASADSTALAPPRVGVASPSNDYLNVAYDTWPLPAYAPLPRMGQFFDVYVQSITNPSNFVVVPLNMLPKLEKMLEEMNAHHNADLATELYGDASKVHAPVSVPPNRVNVNHLYMAEVDGSFYRAIFIKHTQSLLHVLLPDFCQHVLVQPSQLFFLSKQFWSLPFAAFRACLHGVKAASIKPDSMWTESAKFTFIQLALQQMLVALLQGVKEEGGERAEGVLQASRQKLSLHLINTSDPQTDVVITEALLAGSFGVVPDT